MPINAMGDARLWGFLDFWGNECLWIVLGGIEVELGGDVGGMLGVVGVGYTPLRGSGSWILIPR
ncbi:MAG: hypothetical protein VKJ24_07585 [Synechococcales bacterium]|nr:hypothetical protein [Synechococcales bacterium]